MRREILIEKAVLIVLRDALGVELWSFLWIKKNFGPNVRYSVLGYHLLKLSLLKL